MNTLQIVATFSYLMDLGLRLGAVRAARILHMFLLSRMLRVPMWFFDTTPVGRIISRFSKDIDIVDQTIVEVVNWFVWCAFEVILQRLPPIFLILYPLSYPLQSFENS